MTRFLDYLRLQIQRTFPTTWDKCIGAGGASFLGLYLLYLVTFEAFFQAGMPPPAYTYGQQFGITFLLAGSLGVIAGMSVGIALRSSWWLGGAFSCAAGCLGAIFVAAWWCSSLENYGPDTSDWYVFVPGLTASVACHLVGIALTVTAIARGIRSLWRRPKSA